jgi:8-oxo-dGTP pyrophosphatase MutT (NUDIX family)
MTLSGTIRIAAAIVNRADGMTLLVRKRGTAAFMQPGGKIERDEEPVLALCRELAEELGLSPDPAETEYLGRYSAPAAHEPGCMVEADIFRVDVKAPVTPAAEIEEIAWVDPKHPGALALAPLTREQVLPLLTSSAQSSGKTNPAT